MTDHIKTRHKLKGIFSSDAFYSILDMVVLSDTEKEILRLWYLKGLTFMQISEKLGYSERTIKKKHGDALKKIKKIL